MKYLPLTITVLITLVMFSSCKKDTTPSNNSPYYIRATVNGVSVIYNVNLLAQSTAPSVLQIFGSASTNSNADHLDMLFEYQGNGTPNVPIGIGTYTDTAYNFLNNTITGNPYGGFAQLQISGIIYTNFAGSFNPNLPPIFTCTITALDSISVSGTFSGDVAYGSESGHPTKTITGSFYVPF